MTDDIEEMKERVRLLIELILLTSETMTEYRILRLKSKYKKRVSTINNQVLKRKSGGRIPYDGYILYFSAEYIKSNI